MPYHRYESLISFISFHSWLEIDLAKQPFILSFTFDRIAFVFHCFVSVAKYELDTIAPIGMLSMQSPETFDQLFYAFQATCLNAYIA